MRSMTTSKNVNLLNHGKGATVSRLNLSMKYESILSLFEVWYVQLSPAAPQHRTLHSNPSYLNSVPKDHLSASPPHHTQQRFKLTSINPCMKFFGNLAFGSSSARKYFSTCVSCFQKFNVSYKSNKISMFPRLPSSLASISVYSRRT